MAVLARSGTILGIAAFGVFVGCSSGQPRRIEPPGGSGGSSGSGGSTPAPATGGSDGSTGSPSPTSEGGANPEADAGGPDIDASSGADGPPTPGGTTTDGGSTTGPEVNTPTAPIDYGGVGQLVLVPLMYTAQPVPPIVTMDCPDDPTVGYTEYKDSFVVQRPVNLAAKDRFKYENGIYTTWIFPNDKSHNGGGTKPRTETRFSDLGSGEHIMSFDVMVDPGSTGTVIHQYKSAGTKGGNIGLYVQMDKGTLHDPAGTVATNASGKWVNIKSHFNVATGVGHIYLNNCLKVTSQREKNALWYFKFGNYHCDGAPMCMAHFKNIHFYQKDSTDTYNVKSPIP